jgi:hypothetical protein
VRLRATLLALATAGAATLTTAAPAAAAAAVYPSVVATCDPVAGTVTARTAGGYGWLAPNLAVTVEFRYLKGSFVRAGLVGNPAPVAPVRVNATTGPDGTLAVGGYTRAWPDAAAYEFYTETVSATVTNRATGAVLIRPHDGTCTVDRRTTVTLVCDPATNTITARAAGVRYVERQTPQDPPVTAVRVTYEVTRLAQPVRNDPGFSTIYTYPTRTVPVTGGAWSDTGYALTLPEGYYHAHDDLRVTVTMGGWSTVVGRGNASCDYRDAPALR